MFINGCTGCLLSVLLILCVSTHAAAQNTTDPMACMRANCGPQLGICSADPECAKALGMMGTCNALGASRNISVQRCQTMVAIQATKAYADNFTSVYLCIQAKCQAPRPVPPICSCPRPTKLAENFTAKDLKGTWSIIKGLDRLGPDCLVNHTRTFTRLKCNRTGGQMFLSFNLSMPIEIGGGQATKSQLGQYPIGDGQFMAKWLTGGIRTESRHMFIDTYIHEGVQYLLSYHCGYHFTSGCYRGGMIHRRGRDHTAVPAAVAARFNASLVEANLHVPEVGAAYSNWCDPYGL